MKTATYSTTGFVTGSSILWILVISQAALFIMMPVFALGIPPFISVALFIAAIYLGFRAVTGKVEYTVTAEGLTKDVTPNLFKALWKKKMFQFYSWDQIRSFRAGTDTNRSLEQFDYLTIHTRKGKLEINTKKGDRSDFRDFEIAFRTYAGKVNDSSLTATGALVDTDTAPEKDTTESTDVSGNRTLNSGAGTGKHTIREKPDFYRTTFAKILTVFFILMLFGLAAFMILLENGRLSNIFRLTFIILPGVAYMTWRVFIKKEEADA